MEFGRSLTDGSHAEEERDTSFFSFDSSSLSYRIGVWPDSHHSAHADEERDTSFFSSASSVRSYIMCACVIICLFEAAFPLHDENKRFV